MPLLKGENYTTWAIRMQIILEANGLWEMIEPNEKTKADNKKDKTAITFLYQALPEDQLLQISKHKTAKAIWNALKTRHLGEERVQQARLQTCFVAKDVQKLICRWWNLDFQSFDSYDGWLSWFKSIRLGSKTKDVLEGVFYVSWWSLWNFRNQFLFATTKPQKNSIFDDIILRSFTWCTGWSQYTLMIQSKGVIGLVMSGSGDPL
uniref:Zinc finger, CCHC-type n=1 Tax=Tanacetum cinerariifolium TaxID=118510 RepID=A0A6L2J9D8_TANCI|nr:zinc finger, CCHC-type [Tanacetum cinerariifolium]